MSHVTVPDALADVIKAKVESGQYASPEDVLSEALLLLEQRDREVWLRNAWKEGLESGDPVPLDLERFKTDALRRKSG